MTGETALAAVDCGMLAAVAYRGARSGSGTTPGVLPGPARCPCPLVLPAVSASTSSGISGARA
jgi:hypothetical protein